MPDQESIEQQQKLLTAYRRTLSAYMIQRATLGVGHVPPAVIEGIRVSRAEIARIKAILREWGVDVEDLPDDLEKVDVLAAPEPPTMPEPDSSAAKTTPDSSPADQNQSNETDSSGSDAPDKRSDQQLRDQPDQHAVSQNKIILFALSIWQNKIIPFVLSIWQNKIILTFFLILIVAPIAVILIPILPPTNILTSTDRIVLSSGSSDICGSTTDRQIYIMNKDGSGVRQLTREGQGANVARSALSLKDKKYIAFESTRDGDCDVYIMNADGGDLKNLTKDSESDDYDPILSPDGKHIVFTSERDGDPEIYIMDIDGRNIRQLTDNDVTDRVSSWSPDGCSIAFYSDRDKNFEIYTMNIKNKDTQRITRNLNNDDQPKWSPDGEPIIVFRSNRDEDTDIYVTKLPGGTEQSVLTLNNSADDSPNWASGGQSIVFSSERNGGRRIYIMNPDGSNLRPISPPNIAANNPIWLPDAAEEEQSCPE